MITLDDAKRHLNITTNDDDALIQGKIAVAAAWVNIYTGYTPIIDPVGVDQTIDVSRAPPPLKEACRQLVAHLYANREATLVGVTAQALPFGFLDLLTPYRAWAF